MTELENVLGINFIMNKELSHPLILLDASDDPPSDQFALFYREHVAAVRSIIFRYGIRDDLDDVTQQAFIKTWKVWHKLSKVSSPKNWLLRIAINSAIDAYRKRLKYPISQQMDSFPSSASGIPWEDTISPMLQQLSVEHRLVLILYAIEGYAMAEIAEILDIPLGTVKSRLYNARQKAMIILKKQGVSYD
jgi:RNA polymerase sigma-70 factor, ECF subfamily